MRLLNTRFNRLIIYTFFLVLLVLAITWAASSLELAAVGGGDRSHDRATVVQRIVIFETDFSEEAQRGLIRELSGVVVKEIPFINALIVRISPGDEDVLLNSPGVKSVQEDVDVYAVPVEEEAIFTISSEKQESDLFVTSGKTAIDVTRHVALGRVERGHVSGSGGIAILNTGDTPISLGVKGQNAIGTGPLEGHQLRLVSDDPRGDTQYRARFEIAGINSSVVLENETKTITGDTEEDYLLGQGSALRAGLQVDIPSGAPAGMYSTSVTVVAGAALENEGDSQTIPWGVERIGATEAWGRTKGEDVKVAVIDTGIDKNHPDLRVAGGYSVSALGNSSNDWGDTHGHGTHVAGIIAALDNDIGVVGVAPEVELYSVKVMDESGRGSLSGIMEGFQWAIENKIGVINISLTSDKPVPALEECIRAARAAGILTVVAGGNSGPEEDTLRYPANYEDAIAVVATDANDAVADLSSKGKGLDLVAPGIEIR
ncbi:MAG TPA: S8 family peptidase, partial [Clostridia bacterium]|nr:S8 family peptidase [Clostridia bacterium]